MMFISIKIEEVDKLNGKNIAILRKKRGIKQDELAEILSINIATLSRWENGHFEPNASTIKKLCEILHCTESEILNGPNDNKIKVTLSYNWQEFKEGEINMSESKFNLVLGDNGEVGINGSMKVTSKSAIDEVIARIRKELEFGLDMQVKRGIIQEA